MKNLKLTVLKKAIDELNAQELFEDMIPNKGKKPLLIESLTDALESLEDDEIEELKENNNLSEVISAWKPTEETEETTEDTLLDRVKSTKKMVDLKELVKSEKEFKFLRKGIDTQKNVFSLKREW